MGKFTTTEKADIILDALIEEHDVFNEFAVRILEAFQNKFGEDFTKEDVQSIINSVNSSISEEINNNIHSYFVISEEPPTKFPNEYNDFTK